MSRRLFPAVVCSLVMGLASAALAQSGIPKAIPSKSLSVLPLGDSGGQISVDQTNYLQFVKPSSWKLNDFQDTTFELSGPTGKIPLDVQYSLEKQSFYLKPRVALAPGESYLLTGKLKGQSQQLHLRVNGRKGGSGPGGQLTSDLGRWIPDLSQQRDDWSTNLPDHSLKVSELLQAPKGTTAISGQVRFIRDEPFQGATLSIGDHKVHSDAQGRFLIADIAAGSQTLTLEAPGYGTYQAHVDIKPGQTTLLPYTIWLSKLATEHKIRLDSPTTTDVVIRNPEMPGFELRIPKGTIVKDRFGKVVNELTITPLPIDRSPFPLPKFNVPTYFTIQPGASRLFAADGKTPSGAQLIYPNFQHLNPGESGQFWNYDPKDRGWYSYGQGTVSADGKQIVPNEGVKIYELTGAMFLNPTPTPTGDPVSPNQGPQPKNTIPDIGNTTPNSSPKCTAGNPIDCSSGKEIRNYTDISLKDLMPVSLGRSYIQGDTTPRAFGKGWASNLDYYISSLTTRCCSGYKEADFIQPDGQRIHFIRTSPGTGFSDAVLTHYGSQSIWYRATMTEGPGNWTVQLKNGTKMIMPWGSAITSIVDRNGNTLTISRNGQLPTRIQGPTGRYIDITLDSSNRISKATDDQGRSVTYGYDAEGYLSNVTFPDGTTEQYTYVSFADYPSKLLTSYTDRKGVQRSTTEFSRYIAKISNLFEYSDASSANGTNGGDLKRVATATAPSATATAPATGTSEGVSNSTPQSLDCTTYKPSKQTYPDGTFMTFQWTLDNYCRVMSVQFTDARGIKTLREFNIDGNLQKETIAVGTPQERVTVTADLTPENPRWSARGGMPPETEANFDPNTTSGTNFVKSTKDSAGRVTTYKYDQNGNVVESTGPRGTVKATYNDFKQPLTMTNQLGQTLTFSYDPKGNLVKVIDSLNRLVNMTYTTNGLVSTVTDPLGRVMTYEYSGANLSSVKDSLGRTVQFTYDAAGRLLSTTDALGRKSTYQYDINDQTVSVTDPAGKVTSMAYDGNGNLLALTDPLNRVFKWAYDWKDRAISQTDPLNQTEHYGYDANGNPVTATDRKNQTSTAVYDALERLISVTDPVGTTTYGYDDQDRLTSLTENGRTISYAYDNLDQLLSETTPEGKVSYTYDALGKRTSMSVNGGNTITYAYDNGNRLTSMTRGSQTVIFTYDDADHVTGISLPNGLAQLYTYDNADQLTEIRYMKGSTQLGNLTYTYDNAGQRTSMGGSFARTILPTASTDATYDSNNRLTNWKGQNLTYDANGNLTSDGTYTYIWNARDQLTQVKQGTSVIGEYAYGATGKRYSRTLNGSTTSYLYDGVSAVQEKAGAATTDLFGVGIDNYFSKTTNGTTQTYLKDALGSTLGLADNNGALNITYTYGPYGQTSQTGADTNSNQYTGREKDAGNLYYYRARYYNAEFNRFISQDPIGLDGGMNWYSYVGGNPVQLSDPSGLIPNFLEASCIEPVQPFCWGGVALDIGSNWWMAATAGAATGVILQQDAKPRLNERGRTMAQEAQAQAEHDAYKPICENMPPRPPSGKATSTQTLCDWFYEIWTRHRSCARMRQDWDNKWAAPRFPKVPRHDEAILKSLNRADTILQEAIAKHCPDFWFPGW